MNKLFLVILLGSVFAYSDYGYHGSTTSAVILAGSIIKAQNTNIEKKYKRKECPVCEGKGWYLSGDRISKVNCGYCEPDKTNASTKVIVHPPANMSSNCNNGTCTIPIKK
jgi:hypothetical protein